LAVTPRTAAVSASVTLVCSYRARTTRSLPTRKGRGVAVYVCMMIADQLMVADSGNNAIRVVSDPEDVEVDYTGIGRSPPPSTPFFCSCPSPTLR